jgi:23S rRNA maturation-related 3'-5' exoribonuclease YhaM
MKNKIKELLLTTKREGMENLIAHMEEYGFFKAPCSTQHHLCRKGGLAEHSLNVLEVAFDLSNTLCDIVPKESIIIVSLLHDIGKMGQFNKPNYVPNMLKGRATKQNPNPEPYQSESKPYISNPELMHVDHEVRALSIVSKFIDLTEEEQQAILWHNGLYGPFKYEIQGKETPLYMILHWADMWASRVVEVEEDKDVEVQNVES